MRHARIFGPVVALLILASAAVEARGAGMLLPKDEQVPPLAVKYLRVDTTIDNQAATTRVSQEFQNSTGRDLECTFVFPLPKGAAIRDFALYIGGKRVKGELLEKDKARHVYEEIVRRARDPGLLEYMDSQLLRMSIYPVPAKGTQKVELEYSEVIPMDDGLAEYKFPLRVGDKASKTLEDFTVAVRVKSKTAIKSVYSPTHEVGISRPSDNEAVAGMEMKGATLDRDFSLFYTVSDKTFGLSLMTYRPDPAKPGMFLILLSPKSEMADQERVPRDLVFVLDTSGSMKDDGKIGQAKSALKFCIDKLDPADRFAIVQFSTMADTFAPKWSEATDDNKKKAREWIEKMEAAGGTNLSDALDRVFDLKPDEARPVTVMLLTDGRPTVNITGEELLVQYVKDNNKKGLRFFTFGVGDDVNTHLLDRIANDTGGMPEYVRPSEAIDLKVTRLFSKMSHPVLTDLALEIPGVKVTEMYPSKLPDLFRGSQLVIVGAYDKPGDSVIRLKGRAGKKEETLTFEGTFPPESTDKSFIGSIYAHRKIGFLMDQVRLHGEGKELRDEIVRLSLAYGIETPYTSYLVLENEQQYKQYGIERHASGEPARIRVQVGPAPTPGNGYATARPSAPSADALARGEDKATAAKRVEKEFGPSMPGPQWSGRAGGDASSAKVPAAPPAEGARQTQSEKPDRDGTFFGEGPSGVRIEIEQLRQEEVGKTAIDIAQGIQRLREATKDAKGQAAVRQKGGRTFANYRGVWVDERFLGTEKLVKVKWGSEAYFRLLREHPGLRDIFSLGERIVLGTARGQAVAVDADEGAEKLSDDEMKALFTDAPAPAK